MNRRILRDKIVPSIWTISALGFLLLLIFIFSGSKTLLANVPSPAKEISTFVFHDKLKRSDMGGGFIRQYLGTCENMNAQHVDMSDGSKVKMHNHPQVQFGYVIKGGFKVTIGNDTRILKAGDAYFIPAGVSHGFTAIGQTEAIDVFSPARPEIQ